MKYSVSLPITGVAIVEVDAASEAEAINKALEMPLTSADIEEWEATKEITRGNVFRGLKNTAEAQLVEDDEE